MSIKRKPLGKKFWILVIMTGIMVIGITIAVLTHICRSNAQKKLLDIADYMKLQCASNKHYNNGSETQALLRSIESCRQVEQNITEKANDGIALSEDMLKDYTRNLWLYGIIVMDNEGNTVCHYAKDEQVEKQLIENYSAETVIDGIVNANRSYAQRIYLTDGGYINLAANALEDGSAIVITYFYISPETAQAYSLTLQSLLDGYKTSTDGTVMITDSGTVIASNDTSLIGTQTADNNVVQVIKDNADSKHIVHVTDQHCYGLMLKQRDYYIYAYMSDSTVFSSIPQKILFVLIVYISIVFACCILLQMNERSHIRYEIEKENEYKEELLEAVKRADAANESKTRFLQRMSHDIRTPINGICGMIEVGDYYADDLEKQAECRSKIKDASHLLLELINEVLDMGKLESGEIILDEQPFNLHEVLDDVIVVIDKLAVEQGVTLTREHFDVIHWNLIGSVTHVKRLFMNIMSNAVKYNKENGTITIRCREIVPADDDMAHIEFVCEDTGIGMSKEYQKKVFDPFTQENNSVQSKYGGTGLGMPIAKGLVEKMNGIITFESEEGKGTTFIVTIPFKINQQIIEESKENQNDINSIKDYKFLLVEDNELNMEISEFILSTVEAKISKAWNGKEAVDMFARSKPGEYSAIIMDVMMPVMDGYQATREIRAMDRPDAKTIPIIAMTANAFTEDRMKARQCGMDEHISKPIDPEKLIETLDRLMKKSKYE